MSGLLLFVFISIDYIAAQKGCAALLYFCNRKTTKKQSSKNEIMETMTITKNMTNTALTTIAAKALPALSGSSLTYNPEKNVFLTMGYTSNAGNTYYRAIRLSNRLAVYYDLGEGYKYTFLNGITLFAWDGQKANIIAKKTWGGCDWRCFNERDAKNESILMLKDYLTGQVKAMGCSVPDSQLLSFSRSMIEETQRKQLK